MQLNVTVHLKTTSGMPQTSQIDDSVRVSEGDFPLTLKRPTLSSTIRLSDHIHASVSMSGSHPWKESKWYITWWGVSLPTGIPVAVPQATLLQSACGRPFPPAYILLHPQLKALLCPWELAGCLRPYHEGCAEQDTSSSQAEASWRFEPELCSHHWLEGGYFISASTVMDISRCAGGDLFDSLRDTMYCTVYGVLSRSLIYSLAPGRVCFSLEMLREHAPPCWNLENVQSSGYVIIIHERR